MWMKVAVEGRLWKTKMMFNKGSPSKWHFPSVHLKTVQMHSMCLKSPVCKRTKLDMNLQINVSEIQCDFGLYC